MFLSILIPSKRPEGLEKFLSTFKANTSEPWDIEIIVLVDCVNDEPEYVDYFGKVTTIHKPVTAPVSVGNMLHECYKLSSGDWIMFCNDDISIDTFDWDKILKRKIEDYPDKVALLWPNDGMLGKNLSCFPIVSRQVLEAIRFFPTPYRRYKVDDTLYHIFPFNRRVYIPDIMFRHSNDQAHEGFPLGDNRFYPIENAAAEHDSLMWGYETERREVMRRALLPYQSKVKVMIAASTGEYARRADFYDYVNMLEKPNNSILMYCHDRSPASARNVIFQQAIDNNCTHVLLIDDDMAFRSNALTQLLEHDLDIVSGLYFARAYPHKPLIFDLADEKGACAYVNMCQVNGDRLKPIVAAGFGFCLLKVSAIQRIEKPWVRLGELDPEQWCDDIGFFNRARKAGIQSYCDMECRVGHIGTMIVWPNLENGKWYTGYDTGTGSVNVPQPEIEVKNDQTEPARSGELESV